MHPVTTNCKPQTSCKQRKQTGGKRTPQKHTSTTCIPGETLGCCVLPQNRSSHTHVGNQIQQFSKDRSPDPPITGQKHRLCVSPTHVFGAEPWPSRCPTEESPPRRSSPHSGPACRAGKVLSEAAACERDGVLWQGRHLESVSGYSVRLRSRSVRLAAFLQWKASARDSAAEGCLSVSQLQRCDRLLRSKAAV